MLYCTYINAWNYSCFSKQLHHTITYAPENFCFHETLNILRKAHFVYVYNRQLLQQTASCQQVRDVTCAVPTHPFTIQCHLKSPPALLAVLAPSPSFSIQPQNFRGTMTGLVHYSSHIHHGVLPSPMIHMPALVPPHKGPKTSTAKTLLDSPS